MLRSISPVIRTNGNKEKRSKSRNNCCLKGILRESRLSHCLPSQTDGKSGEACSLGWRRVSVKMRWRQVMHLFLSVCAQRRFWVHTWLTGGRLTERNWPSSPSTTLWCPTWFCPSSPATPTLKDYSTRILWRVWTRHTRRNRRMMP